jgi:hypothetical protein
MILIYRLKGGHVASDDKTTSTGLWATPNGRFNHDMLTIEELAEWLRVGKNTIRAWMDEHVLVAGSEFIEVKRVIRFLIAPTMKKLLEYSSQQQPSVKQNMKECRADKTTSSKRQAVKQNSKKTKINLDY